MWQMLTENLLLKLISLAFALVLWFFVMGEQRHEVSHMVPVDYRNVPKGLVIANEVPTVVTVTVSGPRALLTRLSPEEISLPLDMADLSPGTTSFRRLDEKLRAPNGLVVTRISPAGIDVRLERSSEVR
jgi:YbbR domain-containing protein